MNKRDFLLALRLRLSCLSSKDIASASDYYAELISDRMEDGLSEEEAVAAIGNIDDIAEEIISQTPLTKLVKAKIKPKKGRNPLTVILLILGSPVWLSLLIAAFAVVLAVYISLWSIVMSLYAVDLALAAAGFACIVASPATIIEGNFPFFFICLGAGFVCSGLAIFFFCVCNKAAKGTVLAGKGMLRGIKRCFFGRRKKK